MRYVLTPIGDVGDGGEQEVLVLGLQQQHVPQETHHAALRTRTGAHVVHRHTGTMADTYITALPMTRRYDYDWMVGAVAR